MKPNPLVPPRRRKTAKQLSAFTRLELVALLGATSLLACIVAPALASNRYGSERAVCQNNLRLLGRAVHAWVGDHDYRTPWWTSDTQGGTRRTAGLRAAVAWYEYATFTNEIASPSVLACPADFSVKQSVTWDALVFANRQNSISYPIWADTDGLNPNSILSTDRNTRLDPGTSSCSAGFSAVNNVHLRPTVSPNFGWTNAVHSLSGHVLLFDGTVEFTDTERLRSVAAAGDDVGSTHIIRAR